MKHDHNALIDVKFLEGEGGYVYSRSYVYSRL